MCIEGTGNDDEFDDTAVRFRTFERADEIHSNYS
jgi:hypothetical protein